MSADLGGGFKYFLFSPLFDEHIFQMSWFNHQSEILCIFCTILEMVFRPKVGSTFVEFPRGYGRNSVFATYFP